jgi:hypothetical protein
MGWLKRNLFFAIGGILALGLLGAAGFYDFESYSSNQDGNAKLTEVISSLKELNKQKPSPGNEQIDNITTANDQRKQIEEWIHQGREHFQPVPPVPPPSSGPLTSESFASALHRTIAQLQHEADAANVTLPPQFAFSFSADKDRLTFAPGSLEQLAVQLGEVQAVSEILFSARVNALDGIQRFRVSADDINGPQTDYLDDPPVTNNLAILVPYQVTFRSFGPEIAQVLQRFADSPHAFIVKNINVQPAGGAATAYLQPTMPTYPPPPGYPPTPGYPPPTGYPPPAGAQPQTGQTGRGGLQTVLNEQLLRVTMEVVFVKLTGKN